MTVSPINFPIDVDRKVRAVVLSGDLRDGRTVAAAGRIWRVHAPPAWSLLRRLWWSLPWLGKDRKARVSAIVLDGEGGARRVEIRLALVARVVR